MTQARENKRGKLSGRVKFLIFMVVLYGVIAIFNPDIVKDALAYFCVILSKVVPVLVLVFGFLFMVNLFVKPEWVRKNIGTESGLRGWLYAIIGGVLISGPPYIIYPLLGEMRQQGARDGLIAAMLYNRNVKPQFMPAMVYYFGLKYTVVLSVYIILFSVLNGKLVECFAGRAGTGDRQN